MAVAPDVQVGGKLDNISSATNVSVAEKGTVIVALRGYGSYVPKVASEGQLVRVSTEPIEVAIPGGTWSVHLFNNNLIKPDGTYYTFSFADSNGDIVQIEAHQFTAGGIYDFGGLPPYDPSQPPPPLPPLLTNNWMWVAWNAPSYDGSVVTSFGMVLAGDVTATFSNGYPGTLYTFYIQQDGTGGHHFTWPANVHNGAIVSLNPNQALTQTFVADVNGANLYAIGPGTYNP